MCKKLNEKLVNQMILELSREVVLKRKRWSSFAFILRYIIPDSFNFSAQPSLAC